MEVNRLISIFAGFMIMFGLGMAHWSGQVNLLHVSWLWLPLFVGFNLFQMGFTGFCPLVIILRKLGIKKSPCESTANSGKCCS